MDEHRGQHIYIPSIQPDGGELASKLVSLLCITVMTTLFGIKSFKVKIRYLTYARGLVLSLYIMSWLFTCAATLLVSTNNLDYTSCLLSQMSCDLFYSSTKIIIYCWLIEKVWVVSAARQPRWKTWSYRFHVALLLPYTAIAALMLNFNITVIQESGICVIGLKYIASIPLLIYDFIFNLYFTVLFILPLMRIGKSVSTDWKSSRLHDVALRTMAASAVCLFVSFANILALVILTGRQRGLVCLTCCTLDVTINVTTIHWVTNNPTAKSNKLTANSNNNQSGSGSGSGSGSRSAGAGAGAGANNGTVRSTEDKYRRRPTMYNLDDDDDDYLNHHPMYTLPDSNALGYVNNGSHLNSGQPNHGANHIMATAAGTLPLRSSTSQEQYRYVDGRFVWLSDDKGDDSDDAVTTESRQSSLQGSQSSQKSLTKK